LLLVSKTNAVDGLVLTFTYDELGRTETRWSKAKGTTTYTYDAAGNLTGVNYPASTDLAYAYDALNRMTNMTDAAGSTQFSYLTNGALEYEDGPWSDSQVSYGYNGALLRTNLAVNVPGSSDWTQTYGYDAGKRLTSVGTSAGSFAYAYVNAAGRLVDKLSLPAGYITNVFDGVGRLLSTALKNSSHSALNSHAYTYNNAHQRTSQTFAEGHDIDYTYDGLGQLATALGQHGSTNRWHERLSYGYDAAFNVSARTNNALAQTFTLNDANELTGLSSSGTLTVAGTGTPDTINASSANITQYADGTYAGTGRSITDTYTVADGAQEVTVEANLSTSATLSYDGNGNLTSDGWRAFAYDDENRLTKVSVTADWQTEFVYDGLGRMRLRKEWVYLPSEGGSYWWQAATNRYVYDGMRVVQERDGSNNALVSYTRGLDLSGSLEGAGGIGGLLARTDHRSAAPHAYYHADGSGNVTMLMTGAQTVAARYWYDPFGNTIAAKGVLADANVYRFSSKEHLAQSGLYYYGYRFYEPNLQRWPNRDPIGEDGGINLYRFVGNSPVNYEDPMGLEIHWFRPGEYPGLILRCFQGECNDPRPCGDAAHAMAIPRQADKP